MSRPGLRGVKLITEVWFTVAMLIIAAVVLILPPLHTKVVDYYFAGGVVALAVIANIIGRRFPPDHWTRHNTLHELLLHRWQQRKSSSQ